MIEFKADCGHTVRAKDEDAGKVVRCAYCGREADVPQDDQDELDFLFSDADVGGSPAPGTLQKSTSRPRASDRHATPFGTGQTRVDPFAVVKKMSYIAAILVCVIFVGKKYAWPAIEEAFLTDAQPTKLPPDLVKEPSRPKRGGTKSPAMSTRYGFLTSGWNGPGKQGVYVNPVPVKATGYYCSADGKKSGFDWVRDAVETRFEAPWALDLDPGDYLIVVMVPINDRTLKARYQAYGYNALRKTVDKSRRAEADKAADAYFRPDGATGVKVLRMGGKVNIARLYEVTVERDLWFVLTPQFLPYDCRMRDLAELVGRKRMFGFDEEELIGEFRFHRVDPEDWPYLTDILHRVGVMSYRDEEGGFRMFTIDPFDGMISAPLLPGVRRNQPADTDS